MARMCLAGPVDPVDTRPMDQHSAALERAHRRTLEWLSSLEHRPVPPQASIDEVTQALGTALPDEGCDAVEVVDLLAGAGTVGSPRCRADASSASSSAGHTLLHSRPTGWSVRGTRTVACGV